MPSLLLHLRCRENPATPIVVSVRSFAPARTMQNFDSDWQTPPNSPRDDRRSTCVVLRIRAQVTCSGAPDLGWFVKPFYQQCVWILLLPLHASFFSINSYFNVVLFTRSNLCGK